MNIWQFTLVFYIFRERHCERARDRRKTEKLSEFLAISEHSTDTPYYMCVCVFSFEKKRDDMQFDCTFSRQQNYFRSHFFLYQKGFFFVVVVSNFSTRNLKEFVAEYNNIDVCIKQSVLARMIQFTMKTLFDNEMMFHMKSQKPSFRTMQEK